MLKLDIHEISMMIEYELSTENYNNIIGKADAILGNKLIYLISKEDSRTVYLIFEMIDKYLEASLLVSENNVEPDKIVLGKKPLKDFPIIIDSYSHRKYKSVTEFFHQIFESAQNNINMRVFRR